VSDVRALLIGRDILVGDGPYLERAKGGLHVILTEFHESARVDRQLFGRSARQGDPGTAEAIVCFEYELFSRYAPYASKVVAPWCLEQRRYSKRLFSQLVNYAQSKAERHNRKIRLETVKRDRKWLQALGFVGNRAK